MNYPLIKIYYSRFLWLLLISLTSLSTSAHYFNLASALIFLLFSIMTSCFLYIDCKKSSNLLPLFNLNKTLVPLTALIWSCGIYLALTDSLVFGHDLLTILDSIQNKNICWFFNLISLSAFFAVETRFGRIVKLPTDKLGICRLIFAVLGYLFITISFLDLPLSAIGGSGTLAPQIYQAGAFTVFGSLSVLKKWPKLLCSLPILFGSIAVFYEDKREFLAIVVVYLVYNFKNQSVSRLPSFRHILRSLFIAIIIISVVLIQSIARGYGEFLEYSEGDFGSFFRAFPYFFEYLGSANVIGYLANNFEFSYIFASGTVGTYMATQAPIDISYIGSTLVKVFYVPLTLFNIPKPDSFISIVTSYISTSYRLDGGSYPAYLPSEILYNLNFLWPILPFVIAIIAAFYSYVSKAFLQSAVGCSSSANEISFAMLFASVYIQLIFLWRGQGFDMLLVSMIPSLALFAILVVVKSITYHS